MCFRVFPDPHFPVLEQNISFRACTAKCDLKKSGTLACFTHCLSWPGKVKSREVDTLSAVFFLA